MTPRIRCNSATVYYDYVNGNDAWDGSVDYASRSGNAGPLKTMQKALNVAAYGFDIDSTGAAWTWNGNIGYRDSRVTIQMAQVSQANQEACTNPLFLDGAGISGPITVRGDPANISAYNIRGANPLQGFTAQRGASLKLEGFTIRVDQYCTMVNALHGGALAVKDIAFGRASSGLSDIPGGCIGAAMGGQVDVIGMVRLLGSGNPYALSDFTCVFAAIQTGRIHFAPGNSIDIPSASNFGYMFLAEKGSFWVENKPAWGGNPYVSAVPVWTGAGVSGSLGTRYTLQKQSFLGVSASIIPGSAGQVLDSSLVIP